VNGLNWDASYAIVCALMDAHPKVDVETVGLDQLFQWVIALPDFADDPTLAHEALLEQLLREWYEEANAE
jgi:FeS assembly protein IscX